MKKEQKGNKNDSESDSCLLSDDSEKDQSKETRNEERRVHEIDSSPPRASFKNWNSWLWHSITLLMAVIVCLSVSYYGGRLSEGDKSSELSQDKIKRLIEAWRSNYPNQRTETWSTIAAQLTEFAGVAHMSPLVFVMAYDKAVATTKILASEISRAALQMKFESDNCGDKDVAKISGSDIRMKPGFLLNDYISIIKKCGKMIMYNLQELNGNNAKDLHSLLDSDFPNVHEAVYIFTVRVPNVEGNVYGEVQDTLRRHWGADIEDDTLNPLLSRLLNNVKVIPEPVFE